MSEEAVSPSVPPVSPAPQVDAGTQASNPFYERVFREAHEALATVKKRNPEVGSFAFVIDWGPMNETNLPSFSAVIDEPQMTVPRLMNLCRQVERAYLTLINELRGVATNSVERFVVASQELERAKKELETLKAESATNVKKDETGPA